ncbi:MAG: hypothetical protein NZ658_06840 [Pirellulales bacterium]|nr:hypothetical protein [Pirellulales bacterium]
MFAAHPIRPQLAMRFGTVISTILLAGCTMCPDPYDYSGPVPNGSAPQNDFRARSNGIEPIGLAPRPWPPIVKRERGGQSEPTLLARQAADGRAEEIPEVVAEQPLDIATAFESAPR